MRGAAEQLGEPAGEVPQERRGGARPGAAAEGRLVEPLVRAPAVDQVAAPGLPAVETVAVDPADLHQRQGLGEDHLDPRRRQRHADAEPGGEAVGLRPGREDHRVAADGPAAVSTAVTRPPAIWNP